MGFCTDGHLDLQRAVQAIKKGSSVGWGSVHRGYSDLKLCRLSKVVSELDLKKAV